MESFFPCVDSNTDCWDNIHAVICHATHAYSRINEEAKQLQSADSKILALEKQIELLEKELLHDKTQHKVKACLTVLTSEVEEELTQKLVISYGLLWNAIQVGKFQRCLQSKCWTQ